MLFGEVVRALYLRATDVEHVQGGQTAPTLGERLDKFPDTKAGRDVSIFGWLQQLSTTAEQRTPSDAG